MSIPTELRYTSDHEWVREDDDGNVAIGITDHAQTALGDLVFVELPERDTELAPGDACAVVESVKAASDVYAPLAGSVVEINPALEDAPERINDDPYGDGWLYRLHPADPKQIEDLLTADDYERLLAESEDES
jgi:glycine cleavage system H protein